jgi:uncharacterized protein (TIGR03435 family)
MRTWKRLIVVAVVGLGVVGHEISAQPPVFEVASVKINRSGLRGDPPMARFLPGGRWAVSNLTLRTLVLNSYRLQEFQIEVRMKQEATGAANWFNTERFDIAASAGRDASPDELRAMVRTLLADRFKLVAHTETRQQPTFDLVLSRADRQLGPRLQPTKTDCSAAAPPAALPSPGGPLPQCGFLGQSPARVFFRGVAVEALARSALTLQLGRLVVDQTGLTGTFDIDLEWTPRPEEIGPPPPPGGAQTAPSPEGPSLFTALEEQLGLRLERSRRPIEVLVIDHATRPSDN